MTFVVESSDQDSACPTMFGGLDFATLDVAAITSSSDEESESENDDDPTGCDYDPTIVDQLLNIQDDLPSATDSDFRELFDWASGHGAILDGICYGRDAHGGRTLFATQACSEGGLLATLPRSLRIGQAYACQKLGIPLETPDLSALTLLVLAFCQEKHVYARCLPRQSEFTNALLMTNNEQLDWEQTMGPEYGDAIRAMQSRGISCGLYIRDYLSSATSIREEYGNLCGAASHQQSFNTVTLNWAISMVKSRSHAFGSKRGYWLTPILDLVNHSPTPNARLEGDSNGCLALKAVRDIQANEEITIDYQVDDDAQLVATYGFSMRKAAKA